MFRFIHLIYSQDEFSQGGKRYRCDSDARLDDDFEMDNESDDGDGK